MITLNNLGCTPGVPAAEIADWLAPAHRPEEMREMPGDEFMGDNAEECQETLLASLEDEIARLAELEGKVLRNGRRAAPHGGPESRVDPDRGR